VKLKHAKLIHRELMKYGLLATDVLYRKMHVYDKEAKEILAFLIKTVKDSPIANNAQLKSLYSLMEKADERAIECASKLAPYQTPKLESIEVKGKVDHRYVIRAPQNMQSVDQWMKYTGAERLKIEELNKEKPNKPPPTPSIHDFTEDDEYNEPGTPKDLN
jgi:hypothetical protein